MTRNQKVKFLNDLAQGRADILDLAEKRQEVWVQNDDDSKFFSCGKMNLSYTALQERITKYRDRIRFLIIEVVDGFIP